MSISQPKRLELELTGQNTAPCGVTAAFEAVKNRDTEAFLAALQEMNWNPCCVSREIKQWLATNRHEVNGYTVGLEVGAGVSFDMALGQEFIVILGEKDSIEAGVMTYQGLGASLSPTAGASVTQGVLVDDCHKLEDYEGYFASATVLGASKNYGMSGVTPNSYKTGCNSASLTAGLTTSLVRVSSTYYRKASPYVTIRGPRVHALIEMLRKATAQAELNANTRRLREASTYRAEDYIVDGCQDHLSGQIENYLLQDFRRIISRRFREK
jgi:hypothetical protein